MRIFGSKGKYDFKFNDYGYQDEYDYYISRVLIIIVIVSYRIYHCSPERARESEKREEKNTEAIKNVEKMWRMQKH